jgi:hypothetical protein
MQRIMAAAVLCSGGYALAQGAVNLDARIEALAASGSVEVFSLATTAQGRPVVAMKIAAKGQQAPKDPAAVLLVAGADARHTVGVRTALGIAEKVAKEPGAWLNGRTLYIVPCLNPDGLAWWESAGAKADFGRAPRSMDADRDGRRDEDPCEDVNGDGVITLMRIKNPSPLSGLSATLIEDAEEPGVMRAPDVGKGERAVYAVLAEGIDNDGDGSFNEDGVGGGEGSGGGGIDLDLNFPAHWPEFRDGAGRHPLESPEALGLVEFVMRTPGIASVLVFGPRDTVVSLPEAGKMDASGQVPLGIEHDDKRLYESISGKYKEVTGINESPRGELAGSFAQWAYAHHGLPTFATGLVVRPDQMKEEKRRKAPDKPADAEKPAEGATEKPPEAKRPDPKTDEGKWLRWFEDRERDFAAPKGFVPWTKVTHPQLGEVEVGGVVPGAKWWASDEDVARLVEDHSAFVRELTSRLPDPSTITGEAKRVAPGLWRVAVRVTNTGFMPTLSAIGSKANTRPGVVATLGVSPNDVLEGGIVRREAAVRGEGGTFDAVWTVRAADGSRVKVEVFSATMSPRTIEIELKESGL